jgi:hypothetical protein
MAKDQSDRFNSALDVAAALRSAWKGTLDPQHRVHAQTILAALPWGSSARDESEAEIIEITGESVRPA